MFSATWPPAVHQLAQEFMDPHPIKVWFTSLGYICKFVVVPFWLKIDFYSGSCRFRRFGCQPRCHANCRGKLHHEAFRVILKSAFFFSNSYEQHFVSSLQANPPQIKMQRTRKEKTYMIISISFDWITCPFLLHCRSWKIEPVMSVYSACWKNTTSLESI